MSIRVLVTEPDESLRSEYEQSLVKHGFRVFTAATGPDCLQKLREYVPHVLVLEPELPSELGQQVIQLIRDASHVPTVPVVVVSCHDQEQSLIPLDFPVWTYHVKPVSMKKLADSIRIAAEQGP